MQIYAHYCLSFFFQFRLNQATIAIWKPVFQDNKVAFPTRIQMCSFPLSNVWRGLPVVYARHVWTEFQQPYLHTLRRRSLSLLSPNFLKPVIRLRWANPGGTACDGVVVHDVLSTPQRDISSGETRGQELILFLDWNVAPEVYRNSMGLLLLSLILPIIKRKETGPKNHPRGWKLTRALTKEERIIYTISFLGIFNSTCQSPVWNATQ